MQKFGSLNKWRMFTAKDELHLRKGQSVRLRVSTPVGTQWFVNGEFFAVTSGMEVIEFVTDAQQVVTVDDRAMLFNAAEQQLHIEDTGKEVFTKIAVRRERNPEFERIAALAAQNATNRMAAMMDQMERRHREELAASGVDPETGEVLEDGDDDGTAERDSRKRVSQKGKDVAAPSTELADGKGSKGGKRATAKASAGDELSDGDEESD